VVEELDEVVDGKDGQVGRLGVSMIFGANPGATTIA
jgi:hypothetical protein